MKRLYLALIIIAAALAACKQPEDPTDKPAPPPGPVDPPQPENVVGPLSVEASFAEDSFIAGFPGWAEGDAISCFGAGGTHAKLTVKSISGNKATLEGEGDSLGPYTAIYPYSAEDTLESGVITTTVPQDQQISAGPIDRQAFPAVAKADGKALSFKNICGLISFEIADEGITGILVQSTSGTPLSIISFATCCALASASAAFFSEDPVAESAAPVILTRRFSATARRAADWMFNICGVSVI